ncbi:hypothetical protein CDL15_Pgr012271 [Punica granatum]|uniref:Uncharacterized protein n=1 Tax=Punica granatum TaxID=22663 RepID=A0A218WSX0_PUNGR|nr:hypothetical protein CDL15_Pgr012271 [Punica granatum]
MNPETQSESCSMVLVVLGCMPACFRVPFTCPRIKRPESPFKKVSANVQECPGLSKSLLKWAWRCHWSFCPCPHVRTFAPSCQVMSSSLSLGPTFSSLELVDQNGVLTPPIHIGTLAGANAPAPSNTPAAALPTASNAFVTRSSCQRKECEPSVVRQK